MKKTNLFLSKECNKKIRDITKTWEVVNESPYSKSIYSSNNISWGSKEHNSYRISDHWNFETSAPGIHCRTACGTTDGWYLGKYDEATKMYTLICEVFTKEELIAEDNAKDLAIKKYQAKLNKIEKIKSTVLKKGKGLISFTETVKVGRSFIKKEYQEVCEISKNGVWAFTSVGKKRTFNIIGVA